MGKAGYIFSAIAIITILSIGGFVCGWFGEAAQVAQEEFGPRELLKKYEWFKDVAASLDAKKANIEVYAGRITALQEDYVDVPRKD